MRLYMPNHNPFILTSKNIRSPRPVQDNIPPRTEQRQDLDDTIREYLSLRKLVPPLTVEELKSHAQQVLQLAELPSVFLPYAAVMVNNELWRETLAHIPYHLRLLLIPQCLRDKENCKAKIDSLGLICAHCGQCIIDELQTEAENLGYVVMVAEGTPVVMSLIESGQIQAIVGVGCLDSLEKVFPYMNAAAIPGMAIPLLQDGCVNTSLETDRVWEAIFLNHLNCARHRNLKALRQDVKGWFTSESLAVIPGPAPSETEKIAYHWLGKSGKRWRPFLCAGVFDALQENIDEPVKLDVRKLAVAVECFHKASLIHDDIEDNDSLRYGEKTLHEQYGIPLALNIGDFLLGDGYRLIASTQLADNRKNQILQVAAQGHRDLCLGQGAELYWLRKPKHLTPSTVLQIFRQKTAPAFQVALQLGAVAAHADEKILKILGIYSESLGIAYQIHDDLDDWQCTETDDLRTLRPSLLLALAYDQADRKQKNILDIAWQRRCTEKNKNDIKNMITELNAPRLAEQYLHSYKTQAVTSLRDLSNVHLKGLLRRIVAIMFHDLDQLRCCS